MLDCPPVQSLQNSTANFRVSPFSSMVKKGHFSWDAFFNIWKCLLFAGDGYAGKQSIDLAMISLKHETFLQMAPWFWRSIWLAAWQMQFSPQKTLEKFRFASYLLHMRRALPRANLHISVFCACAQRPKVALVSSSTKALATLWKNRKGRVCLNERIRNSWEAIHISVTPYWFWWFSGTNTVQP